MNNEQKKIFKVVLSITAGIVAGILTFIVLAYIFFGFGSLLWTDGGSTEEIRRQETNAAISIILMTSIGSIVGGFTTTTISKKKNIGTAAICGSILFLIWLILNDFSFTYYFTWFESLCPFLILPFAILGGLISIVTKKSNK